MYYLCSKITKIIIQMKSSLLKIHLLIAILLMTFGSLRAGSDILRWGVTAGANITKVSGDGPGVLNTGWRFDTSGGYYVGLSARVSIPIVNLGLDASFLYSQETADLHSFDVGINASDRLRYFSIPIHVRYDMELPALSSALIPFAFVGPQCNLALNDFDWYEAVSQYENWKEMIEDRPENTTTRQQWKLDLGFGVILLHHIQVAYCYAIPLNDTFTFQTAIEDGNNNFRLGTHRIGVTYFF